MASRPRLADSARCSAPSAHQPPLVETALGKQMLALLIQLDAGCTAADNLAGRPRSEG
ncbi:hypothetical protein [Streptomyces sp. NPDC001068]|uniref:hypothetical protein n=1 Tax=Streptomyces sp. NPDC001068 TaxID=3364544 RepID=UPI00369E9F03